MLPLFRHIGHHTRNVIAGPVPRSPNAGGAQFCINAWKNAPETIKGFAEGVDLARIFHQEIFSSARLKLKWQTQITLHFPATFQGYVRLFFPVNKRVYPYFRRQHADQTAIPLLHSSR
jgi:hypothetical protein